MYNEYETDQKIGFNGGYFLSPAQKEAREIKSAAFKAGCALLSVFIITRVWVYIYYGIAALFGLNASEAYSLISDPVVLQGMEIFLSMTMFLFPFVIIAKLGKLKISKTVPFNTPKKKSELGMFLLGVGCCAFANVADNVASAIFESFGFSYNMSQPEKPTGIIGFILSLISTAVVPAIMEEFAFRGIIFGMLKRFGNIFALVTSSLLFGLVHGNFNQMFFALLVGLALGYIRIKTDSIWICVAVHSVNNLFSVLYQYVFSNFSASAQTAINIFYFVLCLFVAVLGIILYSKEDKEAFDIAKTETLNSTKAVYKAFWVSPAIIISIICYMYQAINYFFE